MRSIVHMGAALIGAWLAGRVAAASPYTLHVATNGNDSWSGLPAAPAPGGGDGPLGTIHEAVRRIRVRRPSQPGETIVVRIRDGTHWLAEPCVLTEAESGTAVAPTTVEAFPGETPTLSGGVRVTNWVRDAGDLWSAPLPEFAGAVWEFEALYVDGARATRARFPDEGDVPLRVTAVTADLLRLWLDVAPPALGIGESNSEIVVRHDWSASRSRVVSVTGNVVVAATPAGVASHAYTSTRVGDRAYLEGAGAFLNRPGEWVLDRAARRVRLRVAPGGDPNALRIVAPRLTELLVLRGQPGRPVAHVRFRGLRFEHVRWPLPAYGLPEIYAGIAMPAWGWRPAYPAPVAVEFQHAESCVLEACVVAHVGGSGVGVGVGSRGNRVQGCEVFDTGANGIEIGWRGRLRPDGSLFSEGEDWLRLSDVPVGNAALDNYVHAGGQYAPGALAVWVGPSSNTVVECNRVADMPAGGMAVGFATQPERNSLSGARVARNHVSGIGRVMGDCGGISASGLQPGLVLTDNLIHGIVRSPWARGGTCNGLYLDNGSMGFEVLRNRVYDARDRVFFTYPRERQWQTFRHNAFGAPPSDAERTMAEESTGPRHPYRAPLLGLPRGAAFQSFDEWPLGEASGGRAITNGGWVLSGGATIEADTPCLGRVVRLTDGGRLISPPATNAPAAVSFWSRAGEAAALALAVEHSADGSVWTPLGTLTNLPTAWASNRVVATGYAPGQIRVTLAMPPNSRAWLDLDLMGPVGPGVTQAMTRVGAGGTVRYVSPVGGHQFPYTNWTGAATTLQAAVDAAWPGDTVLATNGDYTVGGAVADGLACRVRVTNDIVVRSVGGPGATAIVGGGVYGRAGATRCARLSAGTLAGFTLTRGTTLATGAWSADSLGGGAFLAGNATLSNCVVVGCSAQRGGGLHLRDYARVLHCRVVTNACSDSAAGVHVAGHGSLHASAMVGNRGGWGGGGVLCDWGPTRLSSCLMAGNSAREGGGAYVVGDAELANCTIVANSATASGGGLRLPSGGGWILVVNSIVWSNSAPTGANVADDSGGLSSWWHTLSRPLPAGRGNLDAVPRFVASAAGDWRLSGESPCVDAGDDQYNVAGDDLARGRRVWRGLDLGCLETPPTNGPPLIWFADGAVTNVPHDVTALAVRGGVNASSVGPIWIRNAVTGCAESFAARRDWAAPTMALAVGTNDLAVSVRSAAGLSTGAVLRVIRGAPGTGTPRVRVDGPDRAVASSVAACALAGTASADAVGFLSASNAANGATARFAAVAYWLAPALALSEGVNPIVVLATNQAGLRGAATTTVTRLARPFAAFTNVTPSVGFSARRMDLGGTNGPSAVGLLTWRSGPAGGGGVEPVVGDEGNLCRGGTAGASFRGMSMAWRAFDGDPATQWHVALASNYPGWVQYDLGRGRAAVATRARFKPGFTNGVYGVREFAIEGSHDERSWVTLCRGEHAADTAWDVRTWTNRVAFRWYRLLVPTAWTGRAVVSEWELYGTRDWRLSPVPLAVGTNAVTAVVTNAAGETTTARVSVVRAPPGGDDADQDGQSDRDEVAAGADPFDADSWFGIVRLDYDGFRPSIRWMGASNRVYRVLRAPDLGRRFEPFTNVPAGPAGMRSLADPDGAGEPRMFYKLEVDGP